MDIISLLVILTGICDISLGFLVLSRGAKNRVTYALGAVGFVCGIFSLMFYLYQIEFIFSALIWIKAIYVVVFLMVFSLFYFFPKNLA